MALALLMVALSVQAQPRPADHGRISGRVIDQATEQPLPAVNVMIEGTQLGAATDEQGRFRIDRVPAGTQRVRFRMIGYKELVKADVPVTPGRTTVIEVELEPAVLSGEEVVVSAGYFQEARDAVVSNRSVDFEEVRSDPGSAEDIQRVMQALPAVVSASDQDNEIIVRGGMRGENLFVMDEIEIPNPNHFGYQGTGGGPINGLNPYFVRRVDFYAGAFPARYGDKVSSVMDITLRDGNREQVTGHAYLGMAGAGAMAEGPIGSGKGSWILSGRKSFLDLIISATGLTAVPQYHNFQGKLVYDFSPRHRLTLNGLYLADRITIEGEKESGYTRGEQNVRTRGHQYAVGATWRVLWGKWGFTKVTLFRVLNNWNIYVYDGRHRPVYNNRSTESENALKVRQVISFGPQLELEGGFTVKGVDFDHDVWSDPDTVFFYDVSADPDTVLGVFRSYPEWRVLTSERSYKRAAYLQTRWFPVPRLALHAGVRFENFAYTGSSVWGPRIGLSLQLAPSTWLNAAYGDHYQSPSYIELTSHPLNRGLRDKHVRQWVVGLEKLFAEDIRGTLEVYSKSYEDVPIPISWTTADPYDISGGRYVSEGKGYARGFEVFLQKKMSGNVRFILSYAHSSAMGYDPRLSRYYPWDFDYRDMFTFISGLRFNLRDRPWYRKWSRSPAGKMLAWLLPLADQVDVDIRLRYLGGRPYTRPTYHPELHRWVVEENQPINANRLPYYFRFDFRIDRRFFFKGWNLVTYLDFMNVTNRDNIWDYLFRNNGTVERVLQWKVLPVGGVAVEF